jgi:hypothetical protein
MNKYDDKIAVDILAGALYQHLYNTLSAFHCRRNDRGYYKLSSQQRGAVTRRRAKGIRIAQAMAYRLGLNDEDVNELIQIADENTAHIRP